MLIVSPLLIDITKQQQKQLGRKGEEKSRSAMEHAIAESASEAKQNTALPSDASVNGRGESPNCVIALAATLSHSSSASGSMDRHVHDHSSMTIESKSCMYSEAAWSDCTQDTHLDSDRKGNATRQRVQSPETDLREYANALKYANGDKDSKDLLKSVSSVNRNPFIGSGASTSTTNSTSIQPPANCVSNEDQEIDPATYSFSSALRECQHKKYQGMRFHASKGSDSSPEYGLVKTAAVISTSNRFTDRERRTGCMDVIADHEFNSREQLRYCFSPRLGLKESQRHRKMHGGTKYPDQVTSPDHIGKEDLPRKHYNELYQDSARFLRTFPSPGMSSGGGIEKGSIPANAYYNNSGHLSAENHIRTQPNMKQLLITGKSKWDDADKWLVGPSSGEIPSRTASYCMRDFNPRPSFKSKHGPAAVACPTSPSAPVFNGRKSDSCVNQGSGIIVMNDSTYNIKAAPGLLHDRISDHGDSKISSNSRVNPAAQTDRMILLRQDTIRENSKLSVSSEKEFAVEDPKQYVRHSIRDAATQIAPAVLRTRDTGTQMSPPGSSCASPCKTPIKSSSPTRHNTPGGRSVPGNNSTLSTSELQSCHVAKLELQRAESSKAKNINIISNRISTTDATDAGDDHSFGAVSKCTGSYLDIGNCKKTLTESRSVRWEEAERVKCQARYKREAAKITAWENHQKAKAEAKLKKLEVRLEKLRSDETEKIMRKLTAAEKKAEDMRIAAAAAAAAHQADHMARTPDNAAAFIRRTGHSNGTLTACFTCRV